MIEWEYDMIRISMVSPNDLDYPEVTGVLSDLVMMGKDGWELISFYGRYAIFKRQKPESIAASLKMMEEMMERLVNA